MQDAIDALAGALAPRLPAPDAAEVGLYADHGEWGLAVSELVGALLQSRVPLTADEIADVHRVLARLRGAEYAAGIADVLDRTDRPLATRGMPPLRGGHLPGDRRYGATEFPAGWTAEAVANAADAVTADPVALANGKRWTTGVVDGVRIGVLRDSDGTVRTVAPLGVRSTGWPQGGGVAASLANGIELSARRLLDVVDARLDPAERQCFEDLLASGEWEELADALAARLQDDPDAAAPLRTLLRGFDLPVPGCDFINRRDATT